jgi:LysM repeat protein
MTFFLKFTILTLGLGLVCQVSSQTCSQKYTVVSGDTCNGIGTKFGVTSSAIISANPTINTGCTNLQIGQILCIPGGSCSRKYTVVSGDTCNGIGTKFGLTGSAIISANPTINSGCTNLKIGQILCIPSSSGGGTSIPNWQSCTKSVSTCADNWQCCVAPVDCATRKTTCRPGGSECSSCGGDSGGLIGWFNQPYVGVPWPFPGTPNANFAAVFYGYNDLYRNIRDAPKIDSRFTGTRYITIGGGNYNGKWSVDVINNLISDINQKKVPAEYRGIGFDIEVGDSGLSSSFSSLFRTAKANGLKVFVTVSGNAPFDIPFPDKCDLMKNAIFPDSSNIDFIVPQLYSSKENPFDGGANECGWPMWKATKIPIVPAIWQKKYKDDPMYLDNWAKNNGLSLSGYMVWMPY